MEYVSLALYNNSKVHIHDEIRNNNLQIDKYGYFHYCSHI